jgi:hypothetical protein
VQWSSGGAFTDVPASSFYRAPSHFRGSPFSLVAYPAATCGSLSTVSGSGVSLATAGVASTFFIQARDFLGNVKQDTQASDEFVAFVRHHDGVTKDRYASVSSVGNGRSETIFWIASKALF